MHSLLSRPDRYFSRPGHLEATVVERHVGGTSAFMRGLRALFVADVHVTRRTTQVDLDRLADLIAGVGPDLLLLGGDYSDDSCGAIRFFDALSRLEMPLGAFGVIGNNDTEAWEGCPDRLRTVMARAGCEMLLNSAVNIPFNGGTIYIAGVDEYRYGQPSAAGLFPLEPGPDIYRILLSHYPIASAQKPDMMLCGHTHGGQFNLLGVSPFTIGFERFWKPGLPVMAVSGFHDMGGMKLLVSKGIGASRIQLRIGVKPEIDLLIFE